MMGMLVGAWSWRSRRSSLKFLWSLGNGLELGLFYGFRFGYCLFVFVHFTLDGSLGFDFFLVQENSVISGKGMVIRFSL
jgi:hypothetical protein